MATAEARRGARRAVPKVGRRGAVPYYSQTTGFSCGPSALLMAMKALDPAIDFSRTHELLMWREANTIFMGGPGPGGCGAAGLALAAHRRGFDVQVWVNHRGTFLDHRHKEKDHSKVMRLLQKADLAEMKRLKIPYRIGARAIEELRRDMADGAVPVVLVNADCITRGPGAHWIVVTGIDDETVTVNDPWPPKSNGKMRRAATGYRLPRGEFWGLTAFGPRKERATVLLRRRR